MDPLSEARTKAEGATERVASLEQNAPEMLKNLKSNLTSIFSKNNPLIQQREQALSTFLATPTATRASTLPANLPQVAGSNLNLSPTQLASVEGGRTAAALAPLASLNNLIVGQYGNIGDILQGAASTYESQINAARTRAAGALDLYKQLAELEKSKVSAGGGLGDLLSLFSQFFNQQQPQLDVQSANDFWEEVPDETISQPPINYTAPLNWQQGIVEGILPGTQYANPNAFPPLPTGLQNKRVEPKTKLGLPIIL